MKHLPLILLTSVTLGCAQAPKAEPMVQDTPPQTQVTPDQSWEGRPDINPEDWPQGDIDPIDPDLVRPGDADPIPHFGN